MSGNIFVLVKTLTATKMMPATTTAIFSAFRMWASCADAPGPRAEMNAIECTAADHDRLAMLLESVLSNERISPTHNQTSASATSSAANMSPINITARKNTDIATTIFSPTVVLADAIKVAPLFCTDTYVSD